MTVVTVMLLVVRLGLKPRQYSHHIELRNKQSLMPK